MILDTKVAKIVLSMLACCLAALATFTVVTGWDGIASKAQVQKHAVALPKTTLKAASTSKPKATPAQNQMVQPEANPTPVLTEVPLNTSEPSSSPAEKSSNNVSHSAGVYIDPSLQKVGPGEEITVSVLANLPDSGISGSEIILKFDPAAFQIIELNTDGVLGSNPLVGLEEKDNQTGILRYALARRGPTSVAQSAETLAKITFSVTDSASSGQYDLGLKSVKLTDEAFRDISGFDIQSGSITVVR